MLIKIPLLYCLVLIAGWNFFSFTDVSKLNVSSSLISDTYHLLTSFKLNKIHYLFLFVQAVKSTSAGYPSTNHYQKYNMSTQRPNPTVNTHLSSVPNSAVNYNRQNWPVQQNQPVIAPNIEQNYTVPPNA